MVSHGKHAQFRDSGYGNDGVSFSMNGGSSRGSTAAFNITIDESTVEAGDEQPNSSEKAQMVGFLYAMLICLVGLMFAVTEALTDIWLQSPVVAAFLLYIYVVAIAFILYLQLYLLRWKPPEPVVKPNMNRRKSLAIQRTPSGNIMLTEEDLPNPSSVPTVSGGDSGRRGSFGSDYSYQEEKTQYVDLSTVGNIFEHSGSSFYLRLGVVIFGIGNLIYVGLEIQYFLQPGLPYYCQKAHGWTFFFRLFFVIIQTFFLFKNPSIHIHKQYGLAHFGFMHLIATNISVWVRTLAQEILDEYIYVNNYLAYYQNLTTPENGDAVGEIGTDTVEETFEDFMTSIGYQSVTYACAPYRELLGTLTHYLFPFVLEYSLIALGMLIIMNGEVGHEEDPNEDILKGLKNLMKVKVISEDIDDIHHNSHGVDVDKAHIGMFAGLMVITGVFVSIILFFYYMVAVGDGSIFTLPHEAILTYQITDFILHALMLAFCIASMIQLSRLSYIAKPVSVDDGLMLISMAGAFMYEFALLVSSIGRYMWFSNDPDRIPDHPWSHEGDDPPDYLPLMMACSSLAAIQTVLQVVVVIMSLRRYSSKREHLVEKPGRGSLIFLVLVNAIVWFYRTMCTKNVHKVRHMEFFGLVPWLILQNSTLPLLLFYRFHSSVCLQDAYVMAYEPITSKIDHVHHSDKSKHVAAAVPANISIPDPVLKRVSTSQSGGGGGTHGSSLSRSSSGSNLRKSSSVSSINAYGGNRSSAGEDNPIFMSASERM